jgi:predicted nucleic acid-binding protein
VIVYYDASALVKQFIAEAGSQETLRLTESAEVAGTSLITRVEVAAAFAMAVRRHLIAEGSGRQAQRAFNRYWADLAKVSPNEAVVSRAETLAWDYALRGYDAVQLASALIWQESLAVPVILATFDRQLWHAAEKLGMHLWPERLAP